MARTIYKLMPHQEKMLDLLSYNDDFILGADMRTGKTLPTEYHITNLMLSGNASTALIVAPLAALGAWTEMASHMSKTREKLFLENTTLINYEKISRKGSKWQTDMFHDWDIIVCDESHTITNPSSNRTRYFVGKGNALGLASRCKYRYLLSGTLIGNSRYQDFWAALRFILCDEYMNYRDFSHRYLVTKQIPGTYQTFVVGAQSSHKQELLDTLAKYSYRITLEDAVGLPEIFPDKFIEVPWAPGKNAVPFTKTTQALYTDAEEAYIEDIDMIMGDPLSRLLRMREIAAGFIKESDTITVDDKGNTKKVAGKAYPLKNQKVATAVEFIEENTPNKTVVFYEFTSTCEQLEKALKRAGVSYTTQNGAQKNPNEWQRFEEDDSIKVILVQYASGNAGIDLHAANMMIFMEPTQSSIQFEQAKKRILGAAQKKGIQYIMLSTEGTIEDDIWKRLQSHQDFEERLYREVALARRGCDDTVGLPELLYERWYGV